MQGIEANHYGHYEIDLKRIIHQALRENYKRLILQVPDGLRPITWRIVNTLEEHGLEVIVSADPCYGACDLAYDELKALNCDAIIHLGHTPLHKSHTKDVIFIEARSTLPIKDALEDSLKYLENYRKIGVAASIQHVHTISEASEFLKEHGKTPYIGKASNRVRYDGQILGCDFTTVSSISHLVEAFLVVSGGLFHGIGVQLATGKPTVIVDPYMGKARVIDKYVEKILKLRKGAERRFLEAKRIGVLVGLKHGQRKIREANLIFKRLKSLGRDPITICAREITPENIDSFTDVDAFVNTACPRIALDGRNLFQKPILNYDEAISILDLLDGENEEKEIRDPLRASPRPSKP